ncbi:hypothetical protein [Sedimenticola selenatireducens]|uniref:Uncharacterized protein n=1 Tax=Sedimenticola selenatireducens TaxID=191960 RepID=A0A557SI27_9GAMM|nr:hypothetical protein [Sedimenticola selenatireducens]TVO77087.1 hypothetical protein FHP88_06610 [Sedimenticola selenatireducens]TVT64530.1 MAG: hypothetical protein FHK78_09855 [Sedimenticola selenatireducens]
MEISGLYIYVDGSDLEEVSEQIESSLVEWLASNSMEANVVNHQHERTPDLSPEDYADWDLGLNITIGQINFLPELLDHTYGLALKHNRDFVVGYYSEASGISEDITFFGAESGKPKTEQITEFLK